MLGFGRIVFRSLIAVLVIGAFLFICKEIVWMVYEASFDDYIAIQKSYNKMDICPFEKEATPLLGSVDPAWLQFVVAHVQLEGCTTLFTYEDIAYILDYVLQGQQFESLRIIISREKNNLFPSRVCGQYRNFVMVIWPSCFDSNEESSFVLIASILAHESDHMKWQLEKRPFNLSLPYYERPHEMRAYQTEDRFIDDHWYLGKHRH